MRGRDLKRVQEMILLVMALNKIVVSVHIIARM